MSLTDQYLPYNFSSTRCFVVSINVDNTLKKIDEKLPPVARRLQGIFITCRSNSGKKLLGVINLNFNDGAIKAFNIPAINSSNTVLKNTRPILFDEELKPHSNMTGYYRDLGFGALGTGKALNIKIYVHYSL